MWKQFGCAFVAIATTCLMSPRAGANKNFVPDWTFQGSSLGTARRIGNADWRAENGEVVGVPKTPEGGYEQREVEGFVGGLKSLPLRTYRRRARAWGRRVLSPWGC